MRSQLIRKDPDAGRDGGQKKEASEDEVLDGITNPIDISLIKLWGIVKDREVRHCCSPWGRKELDMT